MPPKASRKIRMLHHSPTLSRVRAMGQFMEAKRVRSMPCTNHNDFQNASHSSRAQRERESACRVRKTPVGPASANGVRIDGMLKFFLSARVT
jgi:hypothetical protein